MFPRAFPGLYPYRRPHRLFWFVLGGAAATLWLKHKEMYAHEGRWGHCVRVPMRPPPFLQSSADPANTTTSTAPSPENHNQPTSPQPWVFGNQKAQMQKWEEDKARMLELSRQAGDTMTDLSEATLDSVLSAVETLKLKLAEYRTQRQQQQQQPRQPAEEFEAGKKNPPRLV